MSIEQELQQVTKCETAICSRQAPCTVCPVEKDMDYVQSLKKR